MDQELPQKLQTVAFMQIASGAVNFFFMCVASTMLISFTTGLLGMVLSCGFCPLGGICGFAGLVLVPIGILEMLSGALILAQNENARVLVRVTAIAEIASILFGGVGSLVVGLVAMNLLNDPETAMYLEG